MAGVTGFAAVCSCTLSLVFFDCLSIFFSVADLLLSTFFSTEPFVLLIELPTFALVSVETEAFGAGETGAISAAKAGRPETARMPVSASAWRGSLFIAKGSLVGLFRCLEWPRQQDNAALVRAFPYYTHFISPP